MWYSLTMSHDADGMANIPGDSYYVINIDNVDKCNDVHYVWISRFAGHFRVFSNKVNIMSKVNHQDID